MDQLDKEIKEIKRLMLEAAEEAFIGEVWVKRKLVEAAGQKRQQEKGADGQLQEKVWDPGGSQ
jgi:hypothetical protein